MLLNVESKGNRRRTRGSEPIQTGSSHPFPAWQLRASLGCERGCWTGNRRWLAATKGMESKIKGGWQPCAAKRIRENREKERERRRVERCTLTSFCSWIEMKSMDVAAANKEMETKGLGMVTFCLLCLLHANLFTLYALSDFHEFLWVSCHILWVFVSFYFNLSVRLQKQLYLVYLMSSLFVFRAT